MTLSQRLVHTGMDPELFNANVECQPDNSDWVHVTTVLGTAEFVNVPAWLYPVRLCHSGRRQCRRCWGPALASTVPCTSSCTTMDSVCTSSVLPKDLVGLLSEESTTSFKECTAQLFLVQSASSGLLLLMVHAMIITWPSAVPAL